MVNIVEVTQTNEQTDVRTRWDQHIPPPPTQHLHYLCLVYKTLQWRHNEHDVISNHQPHDYLLNRLFRRKAKKTSKLGVTGLCVGNSPVTGQFPAQMASNVENVSIWWRHHERTTKPCPCSMGYIILWVSFVWLTNQFKLNSIYMCMWSKHTMDHPFKGQGKSHQKCTNCSLYALNLFYPFYGHMSIKTTPDKFFFFFFYQKDPTCSFAQAHIDGLVQHCSNSSGLAMELLQSCTKPSKSLIILTN